MHDLTPITALGGNEPKIETIGTLTCTEVPEVALASVSARLGKATQTKTALKKVIEATAPKVERWAGKTVCAFWMGPDQWMVEAPFDTHEELAAQMNDLCKSNASVVEQTDAWARFDLKGANVLAAMELLCNVDSRAMENDHVKRSNIHHLACVVRRVKDDCFALYGPRASAASLHHAIITAMHSVK